MLRRIAHPASKSAGCALLLTVFAPMVFIPNALGQSSSTTVTVELAAQHLFARVADGPSPLTWAARTIQLKENGFTQAQIQLIVQAANVLAAGKSRLASHAAAIHQSLKAKSMNQAAGVQQLKSLDQQRDALLSTTLSQLEADLGTSGATKLEAFLNSVVAPGIVVKP